MAHLESCAFGKQGQFTLLHSVLFQAFDMHWLHGFELKIMIV